MKNRNILYMVVLLIISLFVTFNCTQNNPIGGNNEDKNIVKTTKFGNLNLTINNKNESRTIYPVFKPVSYYDITGDGPDGNTLTVNGVTDASKSISSLLAGNWNITVSGKDVSNDVIVRGTNSINIIEDSTVDLTVDVNYLQTGSGKVDITIDWTGASIAVDEVELKIDSDPTSDIYISGESVNYTNNAFVSGFHRIVFKIKNLGLAIASVTESVHIYDNLETSKTINLTADDFKKPPVAPSGLTSSEGTGKIVLNWTDNSNVETGFVVERSETSGTGYSTLGGTDVTPLSANTATFDDTTAVAGTTYYYRVKSVNSFGSSNYSNEANSKIELPTILSITPVDNSTDVDLSSDIQIVFSEGLDTGVKGTISFGTPAITFEDTTNCAITITTANVTDDTIIINPNNDFTGLTNYSDITVTGFKDKNNNSMNSYNNPVYDFTTIVVDSTPPVIGTAINFTNITTSGVTVNWGAATDNITLQSNLQYKVVYSTTNNLDTITNAETNGTIATSPEWETNIVTKNKTGLNSGSLYYFAVLVKDSLGNKALYSQQAVTTISNNANLSGLSVSVGTLSPTFSSSIINYSCNVPNGTTSVTVTPIKEDANASIEVNINGGTYSVVNSGSPSGNLNLTTGNNIIILKITAQDSSIKIYSIFVNKLLNLTGNVTHLAGSFGGFGSTDGTGSAARFNWPSAITSDGTNLYVSEHSNHTIRKIVISTGVVTTLAGLAGSSGSTDGTGSAARFYNPNGITSDGTNLYVSDTSNHTIRKIVIATGVVTTVAGLAGSSGSTDGTGSAARFYQPKGITSDGTNLYVSDSSNHTIRKIVIATGEVSTFVGSAGTVGSTDGLGASALFNVPICITSDGTYLYVTEFGNHTIRKIVISTAVVSTLAGTAGSSGSTDGTGSAARFYQPKGITSDGTNLYVSDSSNHTIRKIVISSGVVTTVAGTAGSSGSTDGTGSAARFEYPNGMIRLNSDIYITDQNNHTIRKIVIATGVVTTVAGLAGSFGSTDGTGSAARFYKPKGIINDGTNLYVVDTWNHRIRKIVIATGEVSTFVGAGTVGSTDGTGSAARFYNPSGITSDGANLYVSDSSNRTIRKIVISTGVVTTLAGLAGSSGSTDGTGSAARFYGPSGITSDGTNLYVSDSSNHTIRKIVISSGVVTTLAGTAGLSGSTDGTGSAARFYNPNGITSDGTNLYVCNYASNTIRKIVIATGVVTTLAGAGPSGSTDGTGSAARFFNPNGITSDGTNLYVSEYSNQTIRKIVISTGVVTTLAGLAGSSGSADGTGSAARFYKPNGITSDGTNLYICDVENNSIRKIE